MPFYNDSDEQLVLFDYSSTKLGETRIVVLPPCNVLKRNKVETVLQVVSLRNLLSNRRNMDAPKV